MAIKRASPARRPRGAQQELDAEVRHIRDLARDSDDEIIVARHIAASDRRVRRKLLTHVSNGYAIVGSTCRRTEPSERLVEVRFRVVPATVRVSLVDRSFTALVDLETKQVTVITDDGAVTPHAPNDAEAGGIPFALAIPSGASGVVTPPGADVASDLARDRFFRDVGLGSLAAAAGGRKVVSTKIRDSAGFVVGTKADEREDP
jgi:hypothetical protein